MADKPFSRMKAVTFWGPVGVLLTLPLLYLDYGSSEYPELDRGVKVVRYLSANG